MSRKLHLKSKHSTRNFLKIWTQNDEKYAFLQYTKQFPVQDNMKKEWVSFQTITQFEIYNLLKAIMETKIQTWLIMRWILTIEYLILLENAQKCLKLTDEFLGKSSWIR